MEKNVYDKVISINVDVQNDFCPGGALAVAEGNLVVPTLNSVNKWVRDNNGAVIFTADWHPKATAHFMEFGGPWPEHCVQYKAGAAFHDDLELVAGDTVALKGTGTTDAGYSGWQASISEESPLYERGDGRYSLGVDRVEQVVERAANVWGNKKQRVALCIGGLATDYCVKETVLDALKRADEVKKSQDVQIGVFVLRDAIRAVEVNVGDGAAAIAEMQAAGAHFVTSDELINNRVIELGE